MSQQEQEDYFNGNHNGKQDKEDISLIKKARKEQSQLKGKIEFTQEYIDYLNMKYEEMKTHA